MFGRLHFLWSRQEVDDFYAVIALEWRPNWLGRLFRMKAHTKRYRGNGTIWHRLPDFKRVSTFMEICLSEVWNRLRATGWLK